MAVNKKPGKETKQKKSRNHEIKLKRFGQQVRKFQKKNNLNGASEK